MSTLIIHPEDNTTAFLKQAYKGLNNIEVISTNLTKRKVTDAVANYDTIIALGHGSQLGLKKPGSVATLLINYRMSSIFEGKSCAFIWCYSAEYILDTGIDGYGVGMIVSEMDEVLALGLECSAKDIAESNEALTKALEVELKYGEFNPERFRYSYKHFDLHNQNPIIQYNFINI